jgi:hypothetical protein
MSGVENRLAAIGYRVDKPAVDCWRVERIERPVGEPALQCYSSGLRDHALSLWLDRLRDRPKPAVYRVCRVRETE